MTLAAGALFFEGVLSFTDEQGWHVELPLECISCWAQLPGGKIRLFTERAGPWTFEIEDPKPFLDALRHYFYARKTLATTVADASEPSMTG